MNLLPTVFLSLGSNIEPRHTYMQNAINEIQACPAFEINGTSSLLENPALLYTQQNDFLNQIIYGKCTLSPLELLDFLQKLEQKIGRVQRFPNGPREIDLDILCYDHKVMQHQRLLLPHPGLSNRPYLHTLLKELNAYFKNISTLGIYFYEKSIPKVKNHESS